MEGRLPARRTDCMIHFICEHCHRALKASDEDAGKRFKCRCGHITVAESPSHRIVKVETEVALPVTKEAKAVKKRIKYATRAKFIAEFVSALFVGLTVVSAYLIFSGPKEHDPATLGSLIGALVGSCLTIMVLCSGVGVLADISLTLNATNANNANATKENQS